MPVKSLFDGRSVTWRDRFPKVIYLTFENTSHFEFLCKTTQKSSLLNHSLLRQCYRNGSTSAASADIWSRNLVLNVWEDPKQAPSSSALQPSPVINATPGPMTTSDRVRAAAFSWKHLQWRQCVRLPAQSSSDPDIRNRRGGRRRSSRRWWDGKINRPTSEIPKCTHSNKEESSDSDVAWQEKNKTATFKSIAGQPRPLTSCRFCESPRKPFHSGSRLAGGTS